MSIADLSHVLKIFGGSEASPAEQQQLVKEALLMTLSRASSADANIDPCEVSTIQGIIKRETGDDVSTADIRVAAASAIYETAPLEKYLASVSRKLAEADRAMIARSLAEVINSDVKVTSREVAFFNEMAGALEVSAAGLAGLISDAS